MQLAFEAFVEQEYPKYKDFMQGVKGFGLNLLRHQKIREMVRRNYTRTDRHSLHPDHDGCEMDEAGEAGGSPVIAGCEASEMLELAEAAFDAVALSVGVSVMGNGDSAGAV